MMLNEIQSMKTDGELKSNLLTQLNTKLGRSAGNIRVSVLNGIVTLSGYTPSDKDRWAAADIVMHLQGVLAFVDCVITNPLAAQRAEAQPPRMTALRTST